MNEEQTAEAASEDRARKIAEEIGEDRVLVIRPDWSRIVKDAIAVDLDIKWWRGETKLDQKDLGLEQAGAEYQDFLKKNIVLGRKRLMPQKFHKELSSLDARSRELLYRYAYASGWGYLMPKRAYPKWKEEILPFRERFFQIRDELVAQRDKIEAEMRQEYIRAAKAAWKIKTGVGVWLDTEVPSEFIEEFVSSVISRIPSAQEIHDSFCFDWIPAYIETPSELEAEMAQAELVRKQKELEQEKFALERQGIRFQEDLSWQKKQAELEAARRRIREEEELNREIRAKAKDAREKKIEATLDQVAVQLRQMIYEVTVDALASIDKNAKKSGSQFLLGRSSVALRNLVEQVRLLNFTDDAEIERCIRAIEEVAVDREAGDRDIGQIERTLRQIGIITRGELLSLGQAPRSARELEIPDSIDETAVRRARGELQGGGEGVATLPLRQPRRQKADEQVKAGL